LGCVAHVGLQSPGALTEFSHQGMGGLLALEVVDHDRGAMAVQAARYGGTQTASAAGDENGR
jgi:hypothetical protein